MSDLTSPRNSPTHIRSASRHFECEVRTSGRAATWIRVCGELDLCSAPQLEQALEESLSSAWLVIIDLRQLTFIDSTGIHVIIEADARARRSDRRLVFVRGPGQIDRVFGLVGLEHRLRIIDLNPVLVAAPAPAAPAPASAPPSDAA